MHQALPLQHLRSGDRVAEPLVDERGRVLLQPGVVLRRRMIRLLEFWGVQTVTVFVDGDPRLREALVDHTHFLDEQIQQEVLQSIRQVFSQVREQKCFCLEPLSNLVRAVIDDIAAHESVALDLLALQQLDEYTYAHSLAVGVLAIGTGISLGLSRRKVFELGMGALLHDIGKARVPAEVLNKPGRLSPDEWAEMRRHPITGRTLLAGRLNLAPSILDGVAEHHERCDGSGYPYGLLAEALSECGRIIAVTDVYDAMTSDRSYKQRIAPHLTVEALLVEATAGRLDPRVTRAFIRNLALFPVGCRVLLDNGEEGIVRSFHRDLPYRPVVLIVKDASGRELAQPRELDLTVNLTRFVLERR